MKDSPFTEVRLLSLYDRVAEAEDAIPRLRRFVLDLAVRGKLTDAKRRTEEVSLLGDVAQFVMGQAPPGDTCNEHGAGTLFVKVGEFGDRFPEQKAWTTQPLKFAQRGDVLICVVGATVGKLNLGVECAIGRSVAAVRPDPNRLETVYLFYSLMPFTLGLREGARGSAQGVISKPDLAKLAIWLPPLAEQHRIVAKVEELMALLDRLEAARAAREETRTRLTAATLSRLTEVDTDTPTAARFALHTLPALTTHPDQIKTLRQTILNLAVRGKLVQQDAGDEPASDLMKRISTEFSDKTAKGELNKPKAVGQVSSENELFVAPPSWIWARFAEIASIESNLVNPKHYLDMPHVAPDNIQSWTGRLLPYTSVREAGVFSGKHLFKPGVLLYSKIRPNLAKVTKVDFEGLCSADMYPIFPLIDRDFLLIFMITPHFVNQAVSEDNRVAMPKINQAALSEVIVPIPPLAEQHRIVAKVEELMSLCDRLERALQDATTTRARLLDATLREALAGAQEAA